MQCNDILRASVSSNKSPPGRRGRLFVVEVVLVRVRAGNGNIRLCAEPGDYLITITRENNNATTTFRWVGQVHSQHKYLVFLDLSLVSTLVLFALLTFNRKLECKNINMIVFLRISYISQWRCLGRDGRYRPNYVSPGVEAIKNVSLAARLQQPAALQPGRDYKPRWLQHKPWLYLQYKILSLFAGRWVTTKATRCPGPWCLVSLIFCPNKWRRCVTAQAGTLH